MMIRIQKTDIFDRWLEELRDLKGRDAILARIRRVSLGNMGDFKAVGEGVYELRIFVGPGYRIYFVKKSNIWIILLCGGDKSSQSKDIKKAVKLSKEV